MPNLLVFLRRQHWLEAALQKGGEQDAANAPTAGGPPSGKS